MQNLIWVESEVIPELLCQKILYVFLFENDIFRCILTHLLIPYLPTSGVAGQLLGTCHDATVIA